MEYRTNGAIGALLDEYEKSITELKTTINDLSPMELIAVVDIMTKDEDCKSIQKVLSHVISAGYSYVVQIRKSKGEQVTFPEYESYNNATSYEKALDRMFDYNVQFFDDYSDIDLDDYKAHRFTVKWGNEYDIEQLYEHAIVHVLRHRRQIERFLLKLRVQE